MKSFEYFLRFMTGGGDTRYGNLCKGSHEIFPHSSLSFDLHIIRFNRYPPQFTEFLFIMNTIIYVRATYLLKHRLHVSTQQ